MKTYLVKRSPEFAMNGVIVKRVDKNKVYSECTSKTPLSNKMNPGEKVFISENGYGIYAHGLITRVDPIVEFSSINEVVDYYDLSNIKSTEYWMKNLKKFQDKAESETLKYQEFVVDLKILKRSIPLLGDLEPLKKVQLGIYELNPEWVSKIQKFKNTGVSELDLEIPKSLKLDLYSLFNEKHKVSTWIDIDHFVPKSLGGPGNIPENLVPVGFSLNRYKGNSVPSGLFVVANQYPVLKTYVKQEYLSERPQYLRGAEAKSLAEKITNEINDPAKFSIQEARDFYKSVLRHHHEAYVEVINNFDKWQSS